MTRAILAFILLLVIIDGGIVAHSLLTSAPATSIRAFHGHGDTEATSFGCGIERWPVKTLTDANAAAVRLGATVWASPHSLGSLPTPASLPQDGRIAPLEDTVYREAVTLVKFKIEADSDIHLVIAGSSGRTMIAEIPSPSCVQANSPARSRIDSTRAAFTNHFGAPSSTWQTVDVPVRLTGVGFYDFKHGASGASPDGVELHPVLSISFP